jgi:hypothetical protein
VAALAGTSNFLNGFLEHQDFTVTCLNFSGFFLLGLAYKVYSMKKLRNRKMAFSSESSSMNSMISPREESTGNTLSCSSSESVSSW